MDILGYKVTQTLGRNNFDESILPENEDNLLLISLCQKIADARNDDEIIAAINSLIEYGSNLENKMVPEIINYNVLEIVFKEFVKSISSNSPKIGFFLRSIGVLAAHEDEIVDFLHNANIYSFFGSLLKSEFLDDVLLLCNNIAATGEVYRDKIMRLLSISRISILFEENSHSDITTMRITKLLYTYTLFPLSITLIDSICVLLEKLLSTQSIDIHKYCLWAIHNVIDKPIDICKNIVERGTVMPILMYHLSGINEDMIKISCLVIDDLAKSQSLTDLSPIESLFLILNHPNNVIVHLVSQCINHIVLSIRFYQDSSYHSQLLLLIKRFLNEANYNAKEEMAYTLYLLVSHTEESVLMDLISDGIIGLFPVLFEIENDRITVRLFETLRLLVRCSLKNQIIASELLIYIANNGIIDFAKQQYGEKSLSESVLSFVSALTDAKTQFNIEIDIDHFIS